MEHEEDEHNDRLPDNWLNSFEEECIEDLHGETNMEEALETQRELAEQKLWLQFQNSATAIAQLYKDRHQGLSLWVPFQNAASNVTSLFKDGVDSLHTCVDLGIQKGKQHRNRDIVAWVKKKRRNIRREDLLAFLCGKTPPARNRHASSMVRHSQSSRLSVERTHSPRLQGAENLSSGTEPDLQAFREAIALQGLNGAMSNISVGFSMPPGATTPSQIGALPRTSGNMEELNRFILDEFSRNYDSTRKRTSSPDNTPFDSPSRKKSRLF